MIEIFPVCNYLGEQVGHFYGIFWAVYVSETNEPADFYSYFHFTSYTSNAKDEKREKSNIITMIIDSTKTIRTTTKKLMATKQEETCSWAQNFLDSDSQEKTLR